MIKNKDLGGRYKKLGTQYGCGCVEYNDGKIVHCDEHGGRSR